MAIKHIFLDMDGVLTDFVGAVLRLHGQSDLLETWPPGERDIPKVLGMSRGAYWKLIDEQGSDFWASLKPFDWFQELIECVRAVAPFTILTASSLDPGCSSGKVRWLYEHFPKVEGRRFTDYLIGCRKDLLAQPGHVLIDDAESNVDAFEAAGGRAILFPQKWNRNHTVTAPLDYVMAQLDQMNG